MAKEIWKMVVKGVLIGVVYPVANTITTAIPFPFLQNSLWNWFGQSLTLQYLISLVASVFIVDWFVKKFIFKS